MRPLSPAATARLAEVRRLYRRLRALPKREIPDGAHGHGSARYAALVREIHAAAVAFKAAEWAR